MARNGDLAELAAFLGKDIEALKAEYSIDSVETHDDKMRQAQAVLYYFQFNGDGFKTKICKTCEQPFAYNYSSDGVGYCSITCTARALEKIGLQWDPRKPPEQRWRLCVPAVVPPQVLSLMESRAVPIQEVQLPDIDVESPKPHLVHNLDDLFD